MFKNLLAGLCLLTLSHGASAALISFNGYTLDEDKDIVTGGGVEWLQWDVTAGLSINQAIGQYAVDGWRLASSANLSGLFNAFVFSLPSALSWDGSEHIQSLRSTPFDIAEDLSSDPEKQFLALFGNNFPDDYGPTAGSSDTSEGISGLFGEDENGNGIYNVATVVDDFIRTDGTQGTGLAGFASDFGYYTRDYTSFAMGVALVRDITEDSVTPQVSEPPVMALLAFGLFTVIGLRRKQK